MQTNGIYFTRFTYIFDSVKDNVSEFFLRDTEPQENLYLFTEWIQIEKFMHKSNSTDIEYYLRKKFKFNSKDRGLVSGLRKTKFENIYYADEVYKTGKDKKEKKSFILVQVCPEFGILILDYFKNYYPYNRNEFINKHTFEFKPLENG